MAGREPGLGLACRGRAGLLRGAVARWGAGPHASIVLRPPAVTTPPQVENALEATLLSEAEMVFTTLSSTQRHGFVRSAARAPFHTGALWGDGPAGLLARMVPERFPAGAHERAARPACKLGRAGVPAAPARHMRPPPPPPPPHLLHRRPQC